MGVSACCVCVFLLLEESDYKSRCNTTGLNCYVEFCECSSFYCARTEELQLLTFCDNWENVEARVLCTRRACVLKSNWIDIATKEKECFFKAIRQDTDLLRL